MHPIQFIFSSYISFGLVLFITLGWIISNMIRILGKQIIVPFGIVDLDHWARCFGLIFQLISQVNRSFGLSLLAQIFFNFVFLCNGTFYAMISFRERGLQDQSAWLLMAILCVVFFFFVSTLYISHRITQEVL